MSFILSGFGEARSASCGQAHTLQCRADMAACQGETAARSTLQIHLARVRQSQKGMG
jgi:hypothetical protein